MKYRMLAWWICALVLSPGLTCAEIDADSKIAPELVKKAIDYWRDTTSYTEASMTVHRPSWERRMKMRAWTEGDHNTLVRFTAPAKDAGNASLRVDKNMWSYAPRINRVIKIPPSMMTQSWMGSDFSYNDLSKAHDIVDQYDHKLLSTDTINGVKAYTVESIPHEDAPVVWGKEILTIRQDLIITKHEFYDQDMKLVKKLTAKEIKQMGGKLYATLVRMEKVEEIDTWTEVLHHKASFGIDLPDYVFTQANLRNPRD